MKGLGWINLAMVVGLTQGQLCTDPMRLILSAPAANANLGADDFPLTLEWTLVPETTENVTALDTATIWLMEEGFFTPETMLGSAPATAGVWVWQYPPNLLGKYWLLVQLSDMPNDVAGYAPSCSGGWGDNIFNVTVSGQECDTHTDCPPSATGNQQYCDTFKRCSICFNCGKFFDAFDGQCPSYCNVPALVPGESLPDATESETVGAALDFLSPGCPQWDQTVINTNPDIVFVPASVQPEGESDPHRMVSRLSNKLDELAAIVAEDQQFDGRKLKVTQGYVSEADTSASNPPSLHNEARSLRLSLTGTPDSVLLGILGQRISSIGIGWVYYAPGGYLTLSVIRNACTSPVDIVFDLDASGSIESEDHGGKVGNFQQYILGFARETIKGFDVGTGSNQTRAAVVTFQSGATNEFDLTTFSTQEEYQQAISEVPYTRGGTYIKKSFKVIGDEILPDKRDNVPFVIILLTDGKASNGQNGEQAATALKDQGVIIFTVGVGSGIDIMELSAIASTPLTQYLTTVKYFSQIDTIIDRIKVTSCAAASTIDSGSGTGGISVGQCEFKFFTSSCALLSSVEITVTTLTGVVHVYAGDNAQPGPITHLQKDESSADVKVLLVDNPQNSQIYVGIKGIDASNTFTLRIRANPFKNMSNTQLTLSEATPALSQIWEGPGEFVDGETVYSISSGNTDGRFDINPTTGSVSVGSAGLDFDAGPEHQQYTLVIEANHPNVACVTGSLTLSILVTDINDGTITFVPAEYSATIYAGAPAGYPLFTLTATDSDASPSLSILEFTLEGAISKRRRDAATEAMFSVALSSGAVTTAASNMAPATYELNFGANNPGASSSMMATATGTVVVIACGSCLDGEYQSAPCTATSPVTCLPYTNCTALGVDVIKAGTATSDRVCGGQSGSSDGSDNDAAWLGPLIALILLALVLLGVMVRQRRLVEDSDLKDLEAANNSGFIAMDAGSSRTKALAAAAAGSEPVYALSGNPHWDRFVRCTAFDTMYMGNPPCALPPNALQRIASQLQVEGFNHGNTDALYACGRRYMDTALPPEYTEGDEAPGRSEHEIERTTDMAVDFLASAIADVVMEHSIDCLASPSSSQESDLLNDTDYELASSNGALDKVIAAMVADYSAADNLFLSPIPEAPPLRWLNHAYSFGNRRPSRSVAYSIANQVAGNDEYANTPGADQGPNDPSDGLYGLASSGAVGDECAQAVYGLASANTDNTAGEAVYGMASLNVGGTADETIYGLAGAGSRRPSHTEPDYCLGTKLSLRLTGASSAESRVDAPIYAMGTNVETEATYDVAARGSLRLAGATVDESDEATYCLGSAMNLQPTSTYALGDEVPGQSDALNKPNATTTSVAPYAQGNAAADAPSTTANVPPYDQGDAIASTEPSATTSVAPYTKGNVMSEPQTAQYDTAVAAAPYDSATDTAASYVSTTVSNDATPGYDLAEPDAPDSQDAGYLDTLQPEQLYAAETIFIQEDDTASPKASMRQGRRVSEV